MKNESKAYYLQALGLSSNFNETELKDAYRREAKKWHPDLNKDDIYAEERLQLINEAYTFLRSSKNNTSTVGQTSNTYAKSRSNNSKKASDINSRKNIYSSKKIKKFIFYSTILLTPISIISFYYYRENYIFTNPNVESLKKALYEGVYECRERYRSNSSTNFQDAKAFSKKFDGFIIEPILRDRKGKIISKDNSKNSIKRSKSSCFEAKAIPLSKKNTWFEIKLMKVGFLQSLDAISRQQRPEYYTTSPIARCGDISKPGCEERGWWEHGFKGPRQ